MHGNVGSGTEKFPQACHTGTQKKSSAANRFKAVCFSCASAIKREGNRRWNDIKPDFINKLFSWIFTLKLSLSLISLFKRLQPKVVPLGASARSWVRQDGGSTVVFEFWETKAKVKRSSCRGWTTSLWITAIVFGYNYKWKFRGTWREKEEEGREKIRSEMAVPVPMARL